MPARSDTAWKRYHSHTADAFDNPESFDPAKLFDAPVGWWAWETSPLAEP